MDFLYFPDDKSEYIPSVIILIIFILGAIVTMYFILKVNKKEEKKVNEKYKNQLNKIENDQDRNK